MRPASSRTVKVDVTVKTSGVSVSWVRRIVQRTLVFEKVRAYQIGILVANDREIRRLNKRYLGHDYATDVIAFGLEAGQGDIIVSVDTARRYAKEHGLPFREELARYLVHGTLHLLGYEDKKPALKRRMHERQEAVLKKVLS